ncbi:unnamed protein product, partial [Phytomonas sp. Hart1]
MLHLIPQKVRQFVLSESDCKNLLLCSLTTKNILKSIPIDTLVSLSATEASEKLDGIPILESDCSDKQDGDLKNSTSEEYTKDEDWKLVYDLMRASKQGILFLREHMARFMESLENMSPYPLPSYTNDFIKSCLQEYSTTPNGGLNPNLSDRNSKFQMDQNMKVIMWVKTNINSVNGASPSEEKPDQMLFIIYFIKSFFPPPEWYVKGIQFAFLFNARRQNPRFKVIQSQIISRAKQLREASGAFEIMLVDDASNNYLVPEGSRSNYLLITQSGKIRCSDKSDILMGITLLATTRAAKRAGLGAIEHCKLTLKDICSTYALVMLGTSPGVLPVREILLYYDVESEANFRAAASFLNIDVEGMKNFKTISFDPPSAVLEFVVQSDAINQLMKAYDEEKVS